MHIHIHHHSDDRKLDEIIQKLNIMSAEFDALKAKVTAQSTALDTIGTNITGISGDVATLKAKILALENGATPDQIAELGTIVDGMGTKIDAIGTTTAALDAETPPAE